MVNLKLDVNHLANGEAKKVKVSEKVKKVETSSLKKKVASTR